VIHRTILHVIFAKMQDYFLRTWFISKRAVRGVHRLFLPREFDRFRLSRNETSQSRHGVAEHKGKNWAIIKRLLVHAGLTWRVD
jgi:hypothetical protein